MELVWALIKETGVQEAPHRPHGNSAAERGKILRPECPLLKLLQANLDMAHTQRATHLNLAYAGFLSAFCRAAGEPGHAAHADHAQHSQAPELRSGAPLDFELASAFVCVALHVYLCMVETHAHRIHSSAVV